MSVTHRLRIASIAGLLAILALLPATALAGKPVVFHDEWEGAPEFFADCAAAGYGDYMIVGESSGRVTIKEWYDADGNIERAHIFLFINNTIINTGTGQTWRDIGRHTDFYWEFTEFGPTMQKRAGVSFIIHDPDGGILIHDTGTITFDLETGEVLHVGGPHDVGEISSQAEYDELFCTAFE